MNTALPHADVFNSVSVKCGSSKNSDGHCTGLQDGAGDDQLPAVWMSEMIDIDHHLAFHVKQTRSYQMPSMLNLKCHQWKIQPDTNIQRVDPTLYLQAEVVAVEQVWADRDM